MQKQNSKKVAKILKTPVSVDRSGKALAKRTKAELVNVIVEFTRTDRLMMR